MGLAWSLNGKDVEVVVSDGLSWVSEWQGCRSSGI